MPLPSYSNKFPAQNTSYADKYKPGGKKWSDETAVSWASLGSLTWTDLGPIAYSGKYARQNTSYADKYIT